MWVTTAIIGYLTFVLALCQALAAGTGPELSGPDDRPHLVLVPAVPA